MIRYAPDIDESRSVLVDSLSHELLEVEVIKHMLETCNGIEDREDFLVQYAAEKNLTDAIVWLLQYRHFRADMPPTSLQSNLERAFLIFFREASDDNEGISTKSAIERIADKKHPFYQEINWYARLFKETLDMFYRITEFRDTLRLMENTPRQRQEEDNQKVLKQLQCFFDTFIIKLVTKAPNYSMQNALLVRPFT